MGLRYCKEEKSWLETTREERLFCAELYFQMKKNLRPFITILKEQMDDFPEDEAFEPAFEVCFYRDLLHGRENVKTARAAGLPIKRTFDLALLSDETIVIIEAKAQQGFDKKQLEDFRSDIENINEAFRKIDMKAPRIINVGLYSSKYKIKNETKGSFDIHLYWNTFADVYPEMKDPFTQADESYGK